LLTRLPATRKRVAQVRSPALQGALGHEVGAGTRYPSMALWHDGIAQRWLVVGAQAARERAEKSVTQAQQRAGEALKQPRLHWQAKRCETPATAHAALAAGSQAWRSPQGDTHHLRDHQR
jgi:hypothetical protein